MCEKNLIDCDVGCALLWAGNEIYLGKSSEFFLIAFREDDSNRKNVGSSADEHDNYRSDDDIL